MKKNRILVLATLLTFIINIISPIVPIIALAEVNSIEDKTLTLSNEDAKINLKPEIIKLKKEGEEIVVEWLTVSNRSSYEVKINNRIYKTNKNRFIYPAYSTLNGTTVSVREETNAGFSKWSNEKKIEFESFSTSSEKKESFFKRVFTLDDKKEIDYKISVLGIFDGEKKWVDGEQGKYCGPKNLPIEKFKISRIKSPSDTILRYQAYIWDQNSNSGYWQNVKSNGEEAGETGKVITSIKAWFEDGDYGIRYNVISDNRDSTPLISGYIQNGKEVVSPETNKRPLTGISFEIIENLSQIDIETYGDFNGEVKWSNSSKEEFFGPNNNKISKIKMMISTKNKNFSIKYQVYLKENSRWQEWKSEGEEAGEDGKTITNFRAKLEGGDGYIIRYNFKAIRENEEKYISNYGDNGNEIPNSITNTKPISGVFAEICKGRPEVKIQTFAEFIGGIKEWSDSHMDNYYGPLDKPINKFVINLANKPQGTTIKYQAYLKGKKQWQEWKNEGEIAGLDNDVITSVRIKFEGATLGNNIKYKIVSSIKEDNIYSSEYGYNGIEPPGSQVNNKPIASIYVEQYSLAPINNLNISGEEIIIDQTYEIPQGIEFSIPSGKNIVFDYSKTQTPGFIIKGTLEVNGDTNNITKIVDNGGHAEFNIKETGKLNLSYVNFESQSKDDSLPLIRNKGELIFQNSIFKGNAKNSDFIYSNSTKNTYIDDCIIKSWSRAINVDGTGNVRVSRNRIEDNMIGIMIIDGEGYNSSSNIQIEDNEYIGENEIGILVNRSGIEPVHKELIISKNILSDNSNVGIMISSDKLANIAITKNTIRKTNIDVKDGIFTEQSLTKGGPIVINLSTINDNSEGTKKVLTEINSNDDNKSNIIETGNNVDGIVMNGILSKSIKLPNGKYGYVFDGSIIIENNATLLIEEGNKIILTELLQVKGELITDGNDSNPVIISSINDNNYGISHRPATNLDETSFSIYILRNGRYKGINTQYYGGGISLKSNNKEENFDTVLSYGELYLSECYIDNGNNNNFNGVSCKSGTFSITKSEIRNADYGINTCIEGNIISCKFINNKCGIYNSEKITISKCNINNNSVGIDSNSSLNLYNSNIENNELYNIEIFGKNDNNIVNIMNCNIKDSDYGIQILGNPSIIINYNNIYGNKTRGIGIKEGQTVDATYNYWGHENGPSTYGKHINERGYTYRGWSKRGDKVDDGVKFEPICNEVIKGLNLGIDEDKITSDAYDLLKSYSYNLKKRLHEEGVNGATGNYSKKYTDLIIKTTGEDIEFSRTYSSKNDKTGILGYGWNFYYEASLIDINKENPSIDIEGKIVTLPGGEICSFQKEGNGEFTALDNRNRLKENDSKIILEKKEGIAYTFNLEGRLVEITNKEGNSIYLEYISDKISKIYDESDREYIFNYSNNLLDSIQEKINDSNGRIIEFSYIDSQLNYVRGVNGEIQETFEYDPLKKMSLIKNDNEVIQKITYIKEDENKGKIESLTDENDNKYLYTYDNENRRVFIKDSLDNFTEMVYDKNLFLTYTLDRDGFTTLTDYSVDKFNNNILGEEINNKDKLGYTKNYIRDNNGNVILETLPNLLKKQFKYDEHNNLIKEIDEIGNKTFYKYDVEGKLLLKKIIPINGTDEYEENSDDEKFSITTYEYYEPTTLRKAKGLIKTLIKPSGSKIEYTYDIYGNILTEKDEMGNISKNVYDIYGNQIKKIDNKGFITKYEYDKKGNNTLMITPNKGTTLKKYDKYDRLIDEYYRSEIQNGQLINLKKYEYFKSGKIKKIYDSMNNLIEYTYDKYGNRMTEKNSLGGIYSYKYDSLNRLIRTEYKDDTDDTNKLLEESSYRIENISGESIAVVQDKKIYSTKTEFSQVTNKYNHNGDIIEHINGDGSSIKNIYNGKNQLICKIDENKNMSYYYYDINGNIEKSYEPILKDGENTKYKIVKNKYNKDGFKIEECTGLNFVNDNEEASNYYKITYELDLKGNILIEKDSENRRKDYFYDENYNKIKEHIFVDDNQYVVKEFEYDCNNQMIKESQIAIKSDIVGSNILDLSHVEIEKRYEYDKRGNLRKTHFPDGTIIENIYDDLNRITNIKKNLKDSQGNNKIYTEYFTYLGDGEKIKTYRDANGNFIEKIYGKDEKLLEERNNDKSGIKYKYDLAGREIGSSIYDKYNKCYQNTIKEYDLNDKVILEKIINDNGEMIQAKAYKYDSAGNLIKDVTGEEFEKSIGKNIIEKIDNSKGIEYAYNLNKQLVSILKPESKDQESEFTYSFDYDVFGRKIKETDSYNNSILYTLDSKGNVLKKEYTINNNGEPSNPILIESNTYDGINNLISSVDGNGNKRKNTINSLGKIKSEIFSGDSSIEQEIYFYQYDLLGNIALKLESNGSTESIKWNGENKLLYRVKHGSNEKIEEINDYDGCGQLTSHKDANGNITSYKYDTRGNATEISINGVIKSRKEFNVLNNLLYEYDRFGNKLTNIYDEAGRRIETKDAFDKTAEKINYNMSGLKIKSIDNVGNETSYNYDLNNRLVDTIDSLGSIKTNIYNNVDKIVEKIDSNKNSTKYTYDVLGNLLCVENALGEKTEFTYDNNGNRISFKDGKGNVTKYKYNCANKLNQIIAPNKGNLTGKIQEFTYNADGSIKNVKDRNGNIISYEYDLFGRKIKETSGSEEYLYKYDKNGKLLEAIDSSGTTEYKYDDEGRTIEKTVKDRITVKYNYDITNGLLTGYHQESLEDSKGGKIIKTFDKMNKLIKVNDGAVDTKYNYYDNGAKKETVFSDNSKETYEYNKDLTLKKLYHINSRGKTINFFEYSYDKNKNLISRLDSREEEIIRIKEYTDQLIKDPKIEPIFPEVPYPPIIIDPQPIEVYSEVGNDDNLEKSNTLLKSCDNYENSKDRFVQKYTYDKLNRLVKIESKLDGTTNYTYDKAGNRKTVEVIKKLTKSSKINSFSQEKCLSISKLSEPNDKNIFSSFEYDENNRMISIKDSNDKEIETLDYDNNGNLVNVKNNQGVRTLLYDNYNRLVEIKDNEKIVEKNTYNFKGLRVKKDSDSIITNYFYDGDNILIETDEHNNKKARNVYGTKLISRETKNNKWYYRYNGHGDVTNIIDGDEKILEDYRYDSFGELITQEKGSKNPFKYSGYIYDNEAGYYYLKSRMYNPQYGRFIQEDSYLGDINDPLSLNLYTYCFNNPLIYDDQSGHFPHILGGALIGAAFGVASNFIGDFIDDGKINRGFRSYAREAIIGGAEGALLAATAGASAWLGFGVRVGLDMYDTYRHNGRIGARDIARSVGINAISTVGLRKSVKKLASITKVNSVSRSAIRTKVSNLAGKFNINLEVIDKLKTKVNIPSTSRIRTATSNLKSKLSHGINKIKNTKIFGENILSNNKNNMIKQGEIAALDDLDDVIIKAKTHGAYKGASNPVESSGRKFWTNKVEHNGTKVYQRNDIIDPNRVDKMGRTNIERMEQGLAPLGSDGKSVNLHHMTQTNDSAIAEVTQTFHQQNKGVIHINPNTIPSGIDRNTFNSWRKSYWKNRANDFK